MLYSIAVAGYQLGVLLFSVVMVLETFEVLGPFHLNLREGLLYCIFLANCMSGNSTFPYVVTIVGTLLEKDKYNFGFIS